jgi:hypothetical protein
MKKLMVITMTLLVASLIMSGTASAEFAVRTKIVQTLPTSLTVGSTSYMEVTFTNKFKEKGKRQPIYFTAWLTWGGCSYRSGSDPSPVCYKDKGSEAFCAMHKKPLCKTLKTASPKYRWMKPGMSRTVRLPINYKQCLPPNAADPTFPGTVDPTNHYYSGLPCASGRWYILTRGYVPGWGWRNWASHISKDVYVVPPPPG